jgi:hypothetical protein
VCVQCSRSPIAARGGARLALAACIWAAGAWGCAAPLLVLPDAPSSVQGEVRIAGGQASVADLGPFVVYLERQPEKGPSSAGTLTLPDNAGDLLGHELVVLTRGQALRFASESGVAHRLFSVRGQERLDVSVSESGESRDVPMEQTGWIRFYCSLHQDETWDVFVSPTPHFARVGPDGAYQIENVPPGNYRLSIWSPAVEGPVREVRIGLSKSSTFEPIWLDPAKLAP